MRYIRALYRLDIIIFRSHKNMSAEESNIQDKEIDDSLSEISIEEVDTRTNAFYNNDDLYDLLSSQRSFNHDLNDSTISDNSVYECNSNQQTEDSQSSRVTPTFKKIPALNRAFKRRMTPEGRYATTCTYCQTDIKTNETKRFINHIKNCKSTDPVTVEDIVSQYEGRLNTCTIRDDRNQVLKMKWALVMVENNHSFRSLDSKSQIAFFSELNRDFRLHSRYRYANVHIPRLAAKIKADWNKKTKRNRHSISIEFDHWDDQNKRHLLRITSTDCDGRRYLCDLQDTSDESQTGDVISQRVRNVINPFRLAVNEIISDAASACKNAREKIVSNEAFKHCIQHRCMAHLMNLVGKHITEQVYYVETVNWASKVTQTIHRTSTLSTLLRQTNNKKPSQACQVRWYSTVDMFEELIDIQSLLIESSYKFPEKQAMFENSEHWSSFTSLYGVLRPLANCVVVAEGSRTSLGCFMMHLLSFRKSLFYSDWTVQINLSAVTSFLTYISPKKLGDSEFDLLLAAYCLDPRYNLVYLTDDALDRATEMILKIAVKSGLNSPSDHKCLVQELSKYFLNCGSNCQEAKEHSFAYEWWKFFDSGILSSVASRVTSLKSSSGNIERTFSLLKHIQSPTKNMMSIDTLTCLGRVKIATLMNDSNEELSKRVDFGELELFEPNEKLLLPNIEELYRDYKCLGKQDAQYAGAWLIAIMSSLLTSSGQST